MQPQNLTDQWAFKTYKAIALFKKTKTFNFLTYSDDPFVEEGPADFFELYENEKKYGRMMSDEQARREKEEGILSD